MCLFAPAITQAGIVCVLGTMFPPQPSDTESGRRITPSNIVMATVSTAAITGDWITTLHNVRLSQQPGVTGHEINPILGEHPSIGRVNTVFVVAFVTNLAVGAALPSKARNVFWTFVTAIETTAIVLNVSQHL
jgi:hypothetical protein